MDEEKELFLDLLAGDICMYSDAMWTCLQWSLWRC